LELCMTSNGSPNKPDPANPAIAPLFHVQHHRREVADPAR